MYARNEKLINCDIKDEMRESYLNYAMSVIVSRALPDARDGLKPSPEEDLGRDERSGAGAAVPVPQMRQDCR